jgi:hypothetical protein
MNLISDVMSILPTPILIAGSKYDLFRSFEPEKKKIISRFLRYIAHTRGASLLYTSSKDEVLSNKLKKCLSHHAFRSSALQEFTFDHNKPVCVMAGNNYPTKHSHRHEEKKSSDIPSPPFNIQMHSLHDLTTFQSFSFSCC